MGLASIPFLVTIIGAIGTIIKTIWQAALDGAKRTAFYMGVLIPWVIKLISSRVLWRVAVFSSLFVVCSTMVSSIMEVTSQTLQIEDRLQWFFDQFTFGSWLVWDGPLQLHYLFSRLPDVLGTMASLLVFRFYVSATSWYSKLAASLLKGS